MPSRPPADPDRRPRKGGAGGDHDGDRLLRDTWLGHVEALRRERLAAEDPDTAQVRAIVLANERLMRRRGPRGEG